ncbi:hypothetical protein [Mucilaginibacter pedocola]|uniref:Uncharacterized protein n=1 Tax=Mucilaginibacter pedocola TaxID=1792845 RepID=A0A1S9P9X6_9SPHI|nr:hypothetical protein [Mucilaginibacter pedocola]OOQ57388.1 hypothetical protein BC343_14910 [Mucilaginibacter pedocola]
MLSFWYKGRLWTEEDLKQLTGIKALNLMFDDDPGFRIQAFFGKPPYVYDDFNIKVTSKYFTHFYMRISLFSMRIENLLIVSSGAKQYIMEYCIKEQVESAIKLNFSTIELIAERSDKPVRTIYDSAKIDFMNGYKVWGRYGFVMYLSSRKQRFQNLMHDKDCSDINAIHEIYGKSTQAKRAKAVWNIDGFSWEGRFDLKKESDSYRILYKTI